jgi:hypothetical protein
MNARLRRKAETSRGYFMMEALVYIGLVVLVLGTAFAVMFRCVENSVVLRRNAEDVTAAMRAGERWRADIRTAQPNIQSERAEDGQKITLTTTKGQVEYLFTTNTVSRRIGAGPWVRTLSNVRSSEMQADARQNVTPWRWEVELLPRAKGYNKPGRVRPLFTFIAVPQKEGK